MQLGIVGLGRMGAAMRERLRRGGHEVTGFDLNPEVSDVASLHELVDGLDQTTSIVFSEIAVNTGLSDSVFEFEPPAGVDVIGGEG